MSARYYILVIVFFALVAAIAWPLGRFLTRVFAGTNTLSRKVGWPIERALYRLAGLDTNREHTWKGYAIAVLAFSLLTQLITYAILRLQDVLPLNPSKMGAVAPWLSFNTSVSFTTNTNWQSYGGETTMSYLSQAVALTSHNFFSAGVGIAVAIALIRGIARHETDKIGNFWVDLVRVHLYVLLPLCLFYALFLVSQGVIQNFMHPTTWATLDGGTQTLVQGPVASQEAIKMLGTNGGGYFNANSAHPFENPTPLANLVQLLSIFAIGGALCVTLGEMLGSLRHGWAVFITMTLIAVAAMFVIGHFESAGNPLLSPIGVDQTTTAMQPGGNMEGKEVRFGIPDSSVFTVVTTDASCGAVNGMHDSLMPLGGLIPLLNMQLGELVFGGVGSGMYGMLVYVILAIFLSGLMIGRTPEYLGKKIDSRDVRFASFYILVTAVLILGMTSLGVMTEAGRAGILNTGAEVAGASWKPHPHGFSEVFYAFTSAAANNGSAFAGLTAYSADHPVFYSLTLATSMLLGRFLPLVAVLALAGNMAKKKRVPPGPSSFPVGGGLFVALLTGTILLVGALTFFPMLSFGPIVEHFQLAAAAAAH
ncbi:MAG TPA: potassium-transporting ATPase subunit KdpA [Polyangiaceae bacterium]